MSSAGYNEAMIRFVTPQAYSSRVVNAINSATKRVYVLALIIQQSGDTTEIITALNRAAHRGVEVHVMADFSTYSYIHGHATPGTIYARATRIATDMVNRLQSSGVNFTWLGMQHPFVFAGRTHSKWIVCDNQVFAFGGINLHASFQNDHDYMFMIDSADLASAIVTEHTYIREADRLDAAYLSATIDTPYGTVLMDGGLPFDSVIYRRAIKLLDTARSVLVVTQYCPTGKLAHKIRNVQHKVYFNRPSRDFLTNSLINVGEHLSGISNAYAGSTYIHAKYMIVTHDDGTKTAITGSHNFISYGGILGTREIALQTNDPRIIRGLEQFYRKYIA